MFKKLVIITIAIIILSGISGIDSTYTRKAEIVSIKGDIIRAEDTSGHIWEYKGSATIGDNVTLIMYDNHTSKINDDIIKGVK